MRSLRTSTLLKVGTSPTNITEEEKEKPTLQEETKNGPKKVKVPVQKARVEGYKPATWRDYQRHGTDIKQIHIKPEEEELQATARTSS